MSDKYYEIGGRNYTALEFLEVMARELPHKHQRLVERSFAIIKGRVDSSKLSATIIEQQKEILDFLFDEKSLTDWLSVKAIEKVNDQK